MHMTTQVQSGSGDQTNCNTRVVKITKHNEPLGATVSIILSWYQSSNGDWDNTQIWSSLISLWGASGSQSQDNLSPQTASPLWCQKCHFTISFKYFHFSSVFLLILYCFDHHCKHQHIIMMISEIIQMDSIIITNIIMSIIMVTRCEMRVSEWLSDEWLRVEQLSAVEIFIQEVNILHLWILWMLLIVSSEHCQFG